jgi:hypothetical protein
LVLLIALLTPLTAIPTRGQRAPALSAIAKEF